MKIYKLISSNGLIYIGKSNYKYLSSRLAVHKSQYLTERNIYKCKSKLLFENNSIVKIELLEEFDNNDKIFVANREKYYIENIDCVNKSIPNNTKKRIQKYNKNYYMENKNTMKSLQKYTCECGMELIKSSKYRHNKTKYHLKYLTNNINGSNIQTEI